MSGAEVNKRGLGVCVRVQRTACRTLYMQAGGREATM